MSFNTATPTTQNTNVNASRVALTTPVTVLSTDNIIITKLTTPGAVAVNLEASPGAGKTHTIKDGKGDADVNNITITPAAGTIDGQASLVMSNKYESTTLTYTGTEWSIV